MGGKNVAQGAFAVFAVVTTAAAWASCGGTQGPSRPSAGASAGSSSGTYGGSSGATRDAGSSSASSGSSSGTTALTDTCGLPSADASDPVVYDGVGSTTCGTMIMGSTRSGYWFHYNEPDARVTTTVAGVKGQGCGGPTDCAIEAKGSGYVEYAGVGFNLGGGNGTNTPYDASGYSGIELWARGTVTGSRAGDDVRGFYPQNGEIYVELIGATNRDMGDEYGAYCKVDPDPTVWTRCTVDFATAKRLGFLPPPEDGPDMFDATSLYKVQFQFSPFMGSSDGAAPEAVSFDVFIDDVYFY